jgi:hypothetical protein
MAKLRILTQPAYDRLRDAVTTPNGTAAYTTLGPCTAISPNDDLQDLPIYSVRGQLTLVTTTAQGHHAASTDGANAEAVYSYLGSMKAVYAADPRVWAAMTHTECWEYSRWRFPLPANPQKARDHVRSHWFVNGAGLAALRRNAVARLWWAAALTVAPWEQDPACSVFQKADRFYYTKVLLASQQVYQDVMEREFGSNLRLRISFLDALDRARPLVLSLDDLVKAAVVNLTLLLEFRHLLTQDLPEVRGACDDVVTWAASSCRMA